MKKLIVITMVLTTLFAGSGCASSPDPQTWSDEQVNTWFEKGEWLNGWTVKPDASVNKREFANAYFKNKQVWDSTFIWLKNNNLAKLENKTHTIDGKSSYAIISEYQTKNPEDARFELHHNYIDIQYVVDGEELLGIAPLSAKKAELVPYNPGSDIEFMTVSDSTVYHATPDKFFILFPSEIHRPSVKVNENSHVKKCVVKVKI
jgi:YhcH/YjgK/YiaL family protein